MSQERLSTAGDRQRWTGVCGFWTAAEVVYGSFCFVHTRCLLPNRIFAAEAWDLEVEVKISKACTVYKIHLSIVVVFGSDFQWPRRWSDASSWPNQRLPREMVGDPSVRASIAWVSWFHYLPLTGECGFASNRQRLAGRRDSQAVCSSDTKILYL